MALPPSCHRKLNAFAAVDCEDGAAGHAELQCKRCHTRSREAIPRNWILETIRVAFCDQRAWQVDAGFRAPLCPKCAASLAVREAEERSAAKHARDRRVLRMILEAFVPAQGCYVAGWSDQKIAEAAAVPVEVVVEIRQAEGFEILPSPALVAALKDLRAQKAAVLREFKVVTDLIEEARIEWLRRHEAAVDQLRAEMKGC